MSYEGGPDWLAFTTAPPFPHSRHLSHPHSAVACSALLGDLCHAVKCKMPLAPWVGKLGLTAAATGSLNLTPLWQMLPIVVAVVVVVWRFIK